jgi:hypothetical protein
MNLGILFFGYRVSISPSSKDKEKEMGESVFEEIKYSFGEDNK